MHWKNILSIFYFHLLIIIFFSTTASGQTFTDIRDKNIYKTVTIGNQIWMAENLNFRTDSGSWCYENKITNCEKLGRLYNWETARIICPDGWHLPSQSEWKILSDNLGNESAVEGKLQKKNPSKMEEFPNENIEFSKDFILLSGTSFWNGTNFLVSNYGYWWTSSDSDSARAWHRALRYSEDAIFMNISNNKNGYSVRCVKN